MLKMSERETKWETDNDFVLPDLSSVVSSSQVQRDTIDTVSAYYDTNGGDLQTHDIVLRRHDGGDHTGWQLTLPDETDPGGTELYWALSDVPPDEAVGLLTGVTGGGQLHNIGTIHTVRHRHRINEAQSETVIAEIAEDAVRASNGSRLLAWKEIGVEAGPAAGREPKQILRLLKKAGATPARYPSKLAHLSGSTPPAAETDTGIRALASYLNTQIAAVVAGDIALRRGLDPIHDTRVALRRLRSTLRVFAPLFRPDALTFEEELKWYAGLLGEVRDCQVQQGRFTEALDQLPDELVLGPVRARITADLQAIELPARAAARTEMESARYLALLAELTRWRIAAPLKDTPRAGTSEKALRKQTGKAGRKADQRLKTALTDAGESGEQLHRARKAAKRARYAAELLGELAESSDTDQKVKQYKHIQSILGDHQDTVVAREILRRIGAAAGTTAGENGFTFGMLYAREQAIADECLVAVQQLR